MSFVKAQKTVLREIVLYTCDDSGLAALFSGIDKKRGLTFDEIASALKLPTPSTRVLLLSACAFDFLRKKDGRYYARPTLFKQCAIPTEFEMKVFASFAFLPESYRKATNSGLKVIPGTGATLYERMTEIPALEAYYAEGLAESASHMRVPLVLEALKRTGDRIEHVLDVGGGTGTTGRSIRRAYPQMRVSVFDLPTIAAAGEAQTSNEEERLSFIGGNAFADPFPSADCVLFSAFLEVVPEERIDELMSKAYAALPDDGALILVQGFCDDEEIGPMSAALTSLYFFNFCAPRTYTRPVSDFRRRGEQTGFRAFEVVSLDDSIGKAMILRK
jgi:SAM-dependent methyltransferase